MHAVILLLAGCAPAPEGAPALDTSPLGQVDPLVPGYTVADLEGAVAAALEEGIVSPLAVATWFRGLFDELEAGEGDCPVREPVSTDPEGWSSVWRGECAGATRAITGEWVVSEEWRDKSPVRLYLARQLYSFRGETDDGGSVVAGGHLAVNWGRTADRAEVDAFYTGTLSDPAAPAPLDGLVDTAVHWQGHWESGRGFEGTVSGPLTGGGTAVELDLVVDADAAGPTGSLRIRDPSTGWWTVVLADDASGCGAASFDAEELGQSCAGLVARDRMNALFEADVEAGW